MRVHLFVCADSPLWHCCHLSWGGFADLRLVITSLRWAINHLTVTFQFSFSLNSPENPYLAAKRRCRGDVQSLWLSLIRGGMSKQGWPINSSRHFDWRWLWPVCKQIRRVRSLEYFAPHHLTLLIFKCQAARPSVTCNSLAAINARQGQVMSVDTSATHWSMVGHENHFRHGKLRQ